MTINDGTRFIFDNQSSGEYGVYMCSAFDNTRRSSSNEVRTIITTKNPFKETFDLHGVMIEEPLTFDVIVVNEDNTFVDSHKERLLKKWLCKNSYKWLQIDQDDIADCLYRCIATEVKLLDVGIYTGSVQITFMADCNHAWSKLHKKIYQTKDGTLSLSFYNITDYDDYILCPTLIITPMADGNIVITNNTTNQIVELKDCLNTEIITMDGNNDKIKSSNGRVLIDKWNKNFLELVNNLNNITITGDCKIEMQYRLPIRIGG